MARTPNTEKWGRATAKERYSGTPKVGENVNTAPKNAIIGLVNQPKLDEMGRVMQAPQAVNDHHGPSYDNDVKDGWLRGSPPKGATAKPGFDHTRKGK